MNNKLKIFLTLEQTAPVYADNIDKKTFLLFHLCIISLLEKKNRIFSLTEKRFFKL